MSITTSDIQYRLSVKTGSAGNTTASTPVASLGKYIATTQITDNSLENLFDNVTGDENAASDVEYRCFFIHNASATDSWQNIKLWLQSEVAGGATLAIGLDTTAASAVGSASAQALQVTDEQTAPAGVTFSSPTTSSAGLSVGTLNAGQVKAIWCRRTAANTGAVTNDGATLRAQGETA